MTKILAFAGRKQSGKDTLAREACRLLPDHGLFHFAGELKDICETVLGIEHALLWGDDAAKNTLTDIRDLEGSGPLTVREVLQYVGTDIFRALKSGCWAAACMRRIARFAPAHAIIADCRFPDEVEAVQAAGGRVIRLTRGQRGAAHESEKALDRDRFDWRRFNFVLDNARMSVEEQRAELLTILKLWNWV